MRIPIDGDQEFIEVRYQILSKLIPRFIFIQQSPFSFQIQVPIHPTP